jgi:2-dehydropantoate 2-reductase
LIKKKVNFRIVIYGAGAVGGVLGGLLSLSSAQVVLIGRPGNVNEIRAHGLNVVTSSGIRNVKLPAVTSPKQIDFGSDNVVFLCVKGQDTDDAMAELKSVVNDVPIFCFQNGVRNEEIVSKYYPHVYGVMVKAIVFYTRDGEVITREDALGQLVIGRYPEGSDELIESVAVKLRHAGYQVVVTPEIMSYKYGKLIGNLTNAVGAITNVAGEEVEPINRAVQNEGRKILTMAGIKWVFTNEPSPRWPKGAVNQPYNGLSGIPLGSTWQSLTRRQGSVETEFLNGEIVRIAAKLGERAPINETLLHITLEMAANNELPGKYSPTELIKLLRLD